MKKGLLTWNILLSVVTVFLLIMHFTGKKENVPGTAKAESDSMKHNTSFRIAYFEMDSIASNFDLVKQLKTELVTKEEVINTELTNRSKAIQQKINYYQNLAEKGNLSQEASESASREIKGMDDEMKNRKQALDQDYNTYMMTKQNEIKSKIEDFLKEYNKSKEYTYIVSYEQGLFYFKDTTYNITADVVRGLNQKYKPVKKN